jgi:hypothetical protein
MWVTFNITQRLGFYAGEPHATNVWYSQHTYAHSRIFDMSNGYSGSIFRNCCNETSLSDSLTFLRYVSPLRICTCNLWFTLFSTQCKRWGSLCGIMVRGLQVQRSGFDSRRYHILWEVVGLERCPFRLVSTIEELLGRNISCFGPENGEFGRRDTSRCPHDILIPFNRSSSIRGTRKRLTSYGKLKKKIISW